MVKIYRGKLHCTECPGDGSIRCLKCRRILCLECHAKHYNRGCTMDYEGPKRPPFEGHPVPRPGLLPAEIRFLGGPSPR